MKPSIIKAGISTTVTAAVTATLAGLLPATATAVPVTPDLAGKLAGRTVFLDPGHQGPNHSENLARQVDNGRGGTKDCQTTGMTSVNGIPEHTINWNVAQLVKTSLESLGARVVLSRQDDSGWGGCIDDRARAANDSGAAVAVSIHADSAPSTVRGFHLIVPELPIPDSRVDQVQSGPGLAVTKSVRDAYLQAGFPAATYAGVQDGLQTRADIAGPALTAVPSVFVEMGNGANAEDAALLESPDGQLKHAVAITTGLVGYLLGAPPATSGSATDQPVQGDPAQSEPAPRSAPNAMPPGASDGSTQSAPGAAAPNNAVPQSAPGTQTIPGSPGTQASPGFSTGTQDPGSRLSPNNPALPGTQALPGTPATPAYPETTTLGIFANTALEMLMPLARALGMDNTAITAELINLAYTLASKLFGPAR
ncbi:N-acetylmuramoyl-L-alanine amidase [Nocardia lijiangensis]|uniref:N-acetylmuramoyl-L-alanine amidase n=1 Tax=Nocardia lijiangensis TaxID=299618 RepID=UPI00082DFD35|nr:N-acetylmuramoyl-L-alanine amidase [Nocardia lijiangensis]